MNGLKVTDVRIQLVNGMPERPGKLLAFAAFMLNDMIVVHDVKIIQGCNAMVVSMPSRKATDHCGYCNQKNALKARYCSHCGDHLGTRAPAQSRDGRRYYHVDVIHPSCPEARRIIDWIVLSAYGREVNASRQPGYVAPSLYTASPHPLALAGEVA